MVNIKEFFMKKSRRFLILSISIILSILLLTSCADKLEKAPLSISYAHTVGQSLAVDDTFFNITQSFEPDDKVEGYINNAHLKVKMLGYDADYTYFNCFVTVTWSYMAITDSAPTGTMQEHSATIELNASGNGEYDYYLVLQGCRSIYDIKTNYTWNGTATRL